MSSSLRWVDVCKTKQSLVAVLLTFWAGCTHLQKEQCGDLTIWRYGVRSAGLPGAQFERTELSFPLKAGSVETFNLSSCIARSAPLPNVLAVRVPNIRAFIPAADLSGPGYKRKLIELARPLPYSSVVIRVKASLAAKVVAESRIDFSTANWYLAVVDRHEDGIAARPLFVQSVQYDELTIDVLRGEETGDARATALFSSENRSEVEQMAQLSDGKRAILQTLPESYLTDVKDRPRTWPPRWLKLDPPGRL